MKLNLGRFSVGRTYFYGNWFFLYPKFLWIEKKSDIMMVKAKKFTEAKIMSDQQNPFSQFLYENYSELMQRLHKFLELDLPESDFWAIEKNANILAEAREIFDAKNQSALALQQEQQQLAEIKTSFEEGNLENLLNIPDNVLMRTIGVNGLIVVQNMRMSNQQNYISYQNNQLQNAAQANADSQKRQEEKLDSLLESSKKNLDTDNKAYAFQIATSNLNKGLGKKNYSIEEVRILLDSGLEPEVFLTKKFNDKKFFEKYYS
jgi:hypothetical protein